MPTKIQWKPIPLYDRYEVSEHGTIRNLETRLILKQFSNMPRGPRGCRLSHKSYQRGRYPFVSTSKMVLSAFVRLPQGNEVPYYLDGDWTNCRLDNLKWGTLSEVFAERAEKMREKGTLVVGSRSPHAKLNERKVWEIRYRVELGESKGDLAEEFGVSCRAVDFAVERTTWKHVS